MLVGDEIVRIPPVRRDLLPEEFPEFCARDLGVHVLVSFHRPWTCESVLILKLIELAVVGETTRLEWRANKERNGVSQGFEPGVWNTAQGAHMAHITPAHRTKRNTLT